MMPSYIETSAFWPPRTSVWVIDTKPTCEPLHASPGWACRKRDDYDLPLSRGFLMEFRLLKVKAAWHETACSALHLIAQ